MSTEQNERDSAARKMRAALEQAIWMMRNGPILPRDSVFKEMLQSLRAAKDAGIEGDDNTAARYAEMVIKAQL
jgi:hypothetical protein